MQLMNIHPTSGHKYKRWVMTLQWTFGNIFVITICTGTSTHSILFSVYCNTNPIVDFVDNNRVITWQFSISHLEKNIGKWCLLPSFGQSELNSYSGLVHILFYCVGSLAVARRPL